LKDQLAFCKPSPKCGDAYQSIQPLALRVGILPVSVEPFNNRSFLFLNQGCIFSFWLKGQKVYYNKNQGTERN
jgi:hypothetical protein